MRGSAKIRAKTTGSTIPRCQRALSKRNSPSQEDSRYSVKTFYFTSGEVFTDQKKEKEEGNFLYYLCFLYGAVLKQYLEGGFTSEW